MAQFTEFGKDVAKRLIDIDRDQVWLIDQVREKTGLYFDSSYLHKIRTGKLATPKILAAIREILELPKEKEDSA